MAQDRKVQEPPAKPRVKLPTRRIESLRAPLAIALLFCAIFFLFGMVREVSWRIQMRQQRATELVEGKVLAYSEDRPKVYFRTQQREILTVTSEDAFFEWSRPAVGATVDVYYIPNEPTRVHIAARQGFAKYEWLLLPGVLAFLFLTTLKMGLGLLLFYAPA